MIYVEKTPSNQSSCVECKKIIKKGEQRLVISSVDGNWSKKEFHCQKHGVSLLSTLLNKISGDEDDFEQRLEASKELDLC